MIGHSLLHTSIPGCYPHELTCGNMKFAKLSPLRLWPKTLHFCLRTRNPVGYSYQPIVTMDFH